MSIEIQYLIDPKLVSITEQILKEDQTVDIYIHNLDGKAWVFGGPFGSQYINSESWNASDIDFTLSLVGELDNRLGINFDLTKDRFNSDIAIYLDNEIYIDDNSNTIGLAVSNFTAEQGFFWEIFLDRSDFGTSEYFRYGLIHEIAHTLGMEHPFSAHDGDVFAENTDAWSSTFPHETVMSYRAPLNGVWPNSLTENDWNALESTWGVNSSSSSTSNYLRSDFILESTWSGKVRINREKTGSTSDSVIQAKQVVKGEHTSGWVGSIVTGTSENDIVRGLAGFDQLFGKDGDDVIHGGNGRDIIDGGKGSDELHGDFGWNTYKDQRDGSKDLIAIKSDQYLVNHWDGQAGNNPFGEKADFLEGLDKDDEVKIVGVATENLEFKEGVTARGVTGIGIYAGGSLEAVYTGKNLGLGDITQMTTGETTVQWSYWGDNTVPPLQA